jgi:hypothetical protein
MTDGIEESNKPLNETLMNYQMQIAKSTAMSKDLTLSEEFRAKALEEVKSLEQQMATARISTAESAASQITHALAKAEKSGQGFEKEFGKLIRLDSFRQTASELETLMQSIDMPDLAAKVKGGDATAIMQATAIANARELKKLDPTSNLEGPLLEALASGDDEKIAAQFKQLTFLLSEKQKDKLGDNSSPMERLQMEIEKLNARIVEKLAGIIENFLSWSGWKGLAGIYAGLMALAGVFSLLAGGRIISMLFGKKGNVFVDAIKKSFSSFPKIASFMDDLYSSLRNFKGFSLPINAMSNTFGLVTKAFSTIYTSLVGIGNLYSNWLSIVKNWISGLPKVLSDVGPAFKKVFTNIREPDQKDNGRSCRLNFYL